MAEFEVEVKFSLFTLNSKEPEVPSVKPWWCRMTLHEQGTLQANEKRLKTKVSTITTMKCTACTVGVIIVVKTLGYFIDLFSVLEENITAIIWFL